MFGRGAIATGLDTAGAVTASSSSSLVHRVFLASSHVDTDHREKSGQKSADISQCIPARFDGARK
jgi:hypothetical protein